jgi:hypothetical protein
MRSFESCLNTHCAPLRAEGREVHRDALAGADQPGEAAARLEQLADLQLEGAHAQALRVVRLRAGVHRPQRLAVVVMAREQRHRRLLGARVLAQRAQQPPAVEARHVEVGDDDLEGTLEQLLHRVDAVAGGVDRVPLLGEVGGEHLAERRVVVDEEHRGAGRIGRRLDGRSRGGAGDGRSRHRGVV